MSRLLFTHKILKYHHASLHLLVPICYETIGLHHTNANIKIIIFVHHMRITYKINFLKFGQILRGIQHI